jgi:hypothetical protein
LLRVTNPPPRLVLSAMTSDRHACGWALFLLASACGARLLTHIARYGQIDEARSAINERTQAWLPATEAAARTAVIEAERHARCVIELRKSVQSRIETAIRYGLTRVSALPWNHNDCNVYAQEIYQELNGAGYRVADDYIMWTNQEEETTTAADGQ